MTPEQCREARQLLGITREQLADLGGVSVWHVKTFESSGHLRFAFPASHDRVGQMKRALETAGVSFTHGEEPGVELRKERP